MDEARVASIALFAQLGKGERRELARYADEVDVAEGQRLITEGDYAYEFFVIEQGEAEVVRHGEHLADLGPGDFMGETGIMERATRNATVTAKSPMTLVVLTGQGLRSVLRAMPSVAQQIREACDRRSMKLIAGRPQ